VTANQGFKVTVLFKDEYYLKWCIIIIIIIIIIEIFKLA